MPHGKTFLIHNSCASRGYPLSSAQLFIYLSTLSGITENISSLATRFNISVSALYSWLSNFGIETSPTNILSSMSKSNADLIKEIAELKRALEKSKLETWEAQVDALAHKKLLEHMENKYQISVKKRQILSDCRAKRQNIRGKVHWY